MTNEKNMKRLVARSALQLAQGAQSKSNRSILESIARHKPKSPTVKCAKAFLQPLSTKQLIGPPVSDLNLARERVNILGISFFFFFCPMRVDRVDFSEIFRCLNFFGRNTGDCQSEASSVIGKLMKTGEEQMSRRTNKDVVGRALLGRT